MYSFTNTWRFGALINRKLCLFDFRFRCSMNVRRANWFQGLGVQRSLNR
jgi:hypothetical protein